MKKDGVVLTLVIISTLLISVSFVGAGWLDDTWNKFTGKTTENVTSEENITDDEIEVEECAASISISFNQDVYSEGDLFEMTIEVFDSQGNHLPNYAFYSQMYDNMWHSPSLQSTDADGSFRYTLTATKPAGGVTEVKFKVYTEESGSCGSVEGIGEIEFIYGEEPEPESTSSAERSEPETCAARIEINFDQTSYSPGDSFEVEVGVFDSQGNPIPNYPFYVKRYDDRWHSPDLQGTGADGYFRSSGETPPETKPGVTRGIFNAYTKEIGSCGSVDDTIELRLKEPETVPCGIGSCVPEEEKEPEEIPDEKVFYSCTGCELEEKCYPMGYRKEGRYCSDNTEFIDQSKAGICDNSFECKSNVCISGECVGEGLMKKIINWFKKLFGAEPKPPELVQCSKLLIEKNIGDYEYTESGYGGFPETRVPLYSKDGIQIGTIDCCVTIYDKEGEGGAVLICPYGSRKDVDNLFKFKEEEFVSGEYKGEEVYRGRKQIPEMIIWAHDNYALAVGTGPQTDSPFPEPIVEAYLDKYPSDL
jgi:hypothetical protein